MHVEKYLFEIIRVYKKTESIKLCKMCTKRMQENMLDFHFLIYIQKPIACITSSMDLLYLTKTSWCCWIILLRKI